METKATTEDVTKSNICLTKEKREQLVDIINYIQSKISYTKEEIIEFNDPDDEELIEKLSQYDIYELIKSEYDENIDIKTLTYKVSKKYEPELVSILSDLLISYGNIEAGNASILNADSNASCELIQTFIDTNSERIESLMVKIKSYKYNRDLSSIDTKIYNAQMNRGLYKSSTAEYFSAYADYESLLVDKAKGFYFKVDKLSECYEQVLKTLGVENKRNRILNKIYKQENN